MSKMYSLEKCFTYHEVTKYSIQKIFLGHSKTKHNMDILLVQQDNPCICYTEISCKEQICLHIYFYKRGINTKLVRLYSWNSVTLFLILVIL